MVIRTSRSGAGVAAVLAAALVLPGARMAEAQSELIAIEPARRVAVNRGVIVAVSFTARGDSATVLTDRGRVVPVDVSTGTMGTELRVSGKPAGLVRSRDGADLVVGAGAEVTLLGPGAPRRVRVGDDVTSVGISPTGAFVAAGTRSGTVVLMATATGEIASRMRDGHRGPVVHIAFTGTSGETVLSVGSDRNIVYWDVKKAERLRQVTETEPVVISVTATPAGDMLFLGTESTGAKTTSGTESGVSTAGAAVVSGGPLGGALGGMVRPGASSNRDVAYTNMVRAYGVANAAPQKNLDLLGRAPIALAVAPDCRYVGASVRSVRGSSLVLMDIERGASVMDLPLAGRTAAVAFAPDGRTMALGNDAGELLLYSVRGVQPRPRCVADLQGVKYAITGPRTPLVKPTRRIRFAVLDLDDNGVGPAVARAIADQVTNRLALNPGIRLVERRRIAAIVQEQNFQQSGRTEAQGAVQLARILNVQKVVMGAVAKLGTTMTIQVQLVDVETAAIDGSREVQCRACELEDLTQAVSELAETVVGEADPALNDLPPPPQIDIEYPRGDIEVAGTSVIVRGTIRYTRPIEGFELLANGRPQDASRLLDRGGGKMTRLADGSGTIPFVQEVPLEQASNLIAVRAVGADGNDEQRYITVRRAAIPAAAPGAAPPGGGARGGARDAAPPSPGEPPGISLDELVTAIRNRVPAARIGTLVGRFGIAFDAAPAEARLREVGADATIMTAVRSARRTPP
jgi:WD40 repeat protein